MKISSIFRRNKRPVRDADSKRRRREGILIIVIILVVALLTFVETRTIRFGADIPVSNAILMFTLININLLLLILLIFLVFRNLVKLLYDRRRKVMGAKLRTRLVVAFIVLTIVPTGVLFFFSINFITSSIEFWFNVPVEQALENSLRVGGKVYDRVEDNNLFFLERISYQIKAKKLLDPKKEKALSQYIKVVQREFNLDGVEVYAANTQRLSFSLAPELGNEDVGLISAENLQKETSGNGVRSITQEIPYGELVKTIGTIPFGVKASEAGGFVVVTILIPPDLYQNLQSISDGFEEYQQIKLYKKPVQITYFISLSIVALLVLFCAIWVGFYLAKTISIPIRDLAEGTRRVAEGELSFTIGSVADDEIGSLVNSFNKMTRDLRTSREQLELSARKLRDQNIEIEEKRHYMEFVLKNVSAGVVTLDANGMVSTINKSAEKMLGVKSEEVLNKSFDKMLTVQNKDLAAEIMENLSLTRDASIEVALKLIIEGRPRSFLITVSALRDDTGQHMGIVMVFDDLTELEKGQRMAAWREVARRIAHEVKNPLTPITLSAQRLKRKYSQQLDESVFEECTQIIIDQVDLIRNLVNEFSSFARFPSANPKPCDLVPTIEETIALYREGHPNIKFEIQNTDDIPPLNLDRQQIKQALINLIDNAIGAITQDGIISFAVSHDPILKRIRIEVADNGPGISNEDKTRLFEPNFSTKKTGMGLGLTIVSTIIADHNGVISVQDNIPHGAKFVIELPV
ncbi:MAG: PAS domain-containing protein [Deltaproteobacteria bacterium]|nr:PAS domain-containing protein [Deltaproteobacteria bacterium]